MASEIIKAVLQVEEECKQKESEAKKQAEIKKQEAQKSAQKIIEDAEKQVEKMLEDDYSAISDSSTRQLEKEKLKTKKQCDEISETAKKNLGRVTGLVIEMLTS